MIKKGDKFRCIKDVVMSNGGVAYLKGKIYTSEEDGCITNEQGNTYHHWDAEAWDTHHHWDGDAWVEEYFEKVEPEVTSVTSDLIRMECNYIEGLLLSKNRKYGDSALRNGYPFNIPPVTAIKARINDKIARLNSNTLEEDEDVTADLIGYLILLRVAQKHEIERGDF